MKKTIATRFIYECKKCGTYIEVVIPYTFPDGTRFPWEMDEIRSPECPTQYAKTSGWPAAHEIKLLKTERVKENE